MIDVNNPAQLTVSELSVYCKGVEWEDLAQRIRELEHVRHVELRSQLQEWFHLLVFVDKRYDDRTRFEILMKFDRANPVGSSFVVDVANLGPVM